MKKLLAALMLVSSAAYAQQEWVARAPNKAGGLLVLLAHKGSCSVGLRMYSNSSDGNMTWGCWSTNDNHVLVIWDEGSQRTSAFPYDMWEMNRNRPKGTVM